MKTVKIKWPPPHRKTKYNKAGTQVKGDGEPTILWLQRYEHDHALRASLDNTCCGCGFTHIKTYEVVRQDDGVFWLICRSYAKEETRPKGPRRRKE